VDAEQTKAAERAEALAIAAPRAVSIEPARIGAELSHHGRELLSRATACEP